MTDEVKFLKAQAEKCRWLAAHIAAKDVAQTLLQMAQEYEERAERTAPDKAEG